MKRRRQDAIDKEMSTSQNSVPWKVNYKDRTVSPPQGRNQKRRGAQAGRPGDPGTHMHVVDAIATDGPSVVAEIILNGRVPHLQFRSGARGPFSACDGQHTPGAQKLHSALTPGLPSVTQSHSDVQLKTNTQSIII